MLPIHICWSMPPDFDRVPELAEVSAAVRAAFPNWLGTGVPFHSGKLTSTFRPIHFFDDWTKAQSVDANLTQSVKSYTHLSRCRAGTGCRVVW